MRWSMPWLAFFVFAPRAAPPAEPSADALFGTVRALAGAEAVAGAAFASRHIDHPDHDRARSWLRDQLTAIDGVTVADDPFSALGHDDLGNLVADLPATGDGPMIVIGAHLDSTASRTDGWSAATDPAPGADDDASGVAAVLELARILAAERLAVPVRLVLFDAEEEGLLGSAHHAAQYAPGSVAWMVSLDPIGHNPGGADVLWVNYDPRWPDVADALVDTAEAIGSPLALQPVDGSLLGSNSQRSDHAPFWEAGHPAVHIASFPQPPDYHEVTDTPDVVDAAFLQAVTALILARVREVASAPATSPPAGRRTAAGGCRGG